MATKGKTSSCTAFSDKETDCCKVIAVVSVDERGQMVLPKEIRERAQINTGDKLAVFSWEKKGEVCCISLIKVEQFAGKIKEILGPMFKEIFSK